MFNRAESRKIPPLTPIPPCHTSDPTPTNPHPSIRATLLQYQVSSLISTHSTSLQHIPSSALRSKSTRTHERKSCSSFLFRAESRSFPIADKIPTLHTLDLHQHKSAQSQKFSIPVFSHLTHLHPLCQPTAHTLKCPRSKSTRAHERKSCSSFLFRAESRRSSLRQ